MNLIENDKDVLQTVLVNELRNVYNIKYHKDSTKPKKLNQVRRIFLSPRKSRISPPNPSLLGQITEEPRLQCAIATLAADGRYPGERGRRASSTLHFRCMPKDP